MDSSSSKNYDERYEFNAPQTFIDFTNLQEDDGEDSFFDCPTDTRSKSLQNLALGEEEPLESPTEDPSAAGPSTALPAAAELVQDQQQQPEEDGESMDTGEAAISTAAAETEAEPSASLAHPGEPASFVADQETEPTASIADQDAEPAASVSEAEAAIESMETGTSEAEAEDSVDRPITRSCLKGPLGTDGVFLEPPVRHSPRLAAIAKAITNSGGKKRSSSVGGNKVRRRSLSVGPALHRNKAGGGSLSAEERSHLAQFAVLRNKADSTRGRQNSTRVGRQQPTRPMEFKFATDSRIKGVSSAAPPASAADFARTLRSTAKNASSINKNQHRGPTKPQPFKLSENRKPATADQQQQHADKFISMAELNMKYHCQTPERFRTKPKNGLPHHGGSHGGINSVGLTKPQTPKLSTTTRSRSVHYPTREEEEELALQEALKTKLPSRPLNPKVFEPPKLNAIPTKPVTIPKPFAITETKKEQMVAATSLAHLLNDSTLSSVPHAGVPPVSHRVSTKVQPFSFDDRDQNMIRKKQEKIQEVLEKEKAMAEFHARPMPVFDGGPKGLPNKKPPVATKPEPFDLKIDKRGEIKKQMIEKECQEREAKDRQGRQFHARPATVTTKDPFRPAPSVKPLTEISEFALNTEKRSMQRSEYDMHLKMKEDEIRAQKQLLEERLAAEEEARIAEERKRIVHKSQPMPQFPAPQLQPSERPLTVPVAPNFATDGRLRSARSRSSVNSTLDTTASSNLSGFSRLH